MDAKRFDDLARSVGNRRGLIRGALGAAAATIGLNASNVLAACRPGGWSCQRNSDCCSNECYLPSKTSRDRICKECVPVSNEQTCAGVACGSVLNNCGQKVTCPGSCSHLNDQCHVGKCQGNACVAVPLVGKECDDRDICTNSVCNLHGQCVGTPKCDDGDPCTVDTCNGETGACAYTDKCPPQGPCFTVSCRAGECINTPIEGCCVDSDDCDEGDICNADGICQSCATCATFESCGDNCYVGCDATQSPFCFYSRSCSAVATCSVDSDCSDDELCLIASCCSEPTCGLLCSEAGGASFAAGVDGPTQAGG